jgi:tRNA 2-thiouridine synthesizing protein A
LRVTINTNLQAYTSVYPRSSAGGITMNADELKNLSVAKVVDARGTACPGPLLEAKRGMAAVPMNGILEVLSSDEGTNQDMPLWSKKVGHEFLGSIAEAGYWRIFVKRGK